MYVWFGNHQSHLDDGYVTNSDSYIRLCNHGHCLLWLSSSLPPSAVTFQSYILGFLWFLLGSIYIFSLSLAKTKPSLATAFQNSIYKIKSCVESEKHTCGIVYIFTLCFGYFTAIMPYNAHFFMWPIPITKTCVLSAKIIQTRLLHHWYIPDVSFTDCTHALHYTYLRSDSVITHRQLII